MLNKGNVTPLLGEKVIFPQAYNVRYFIYWGPWVLSAAWKFCGLREHWASRTKLKDVRAHCYCASLVHTLFIGHARATSFSSTESKTRQNIELMTFALTWCANIFVGCSVNPTFFRQIDITFFSDSFHYTKKKTQKKKVCAWEVVIISHNFK